MASYDFIDASGKGFKFLWHNRSFIIPLILYPIILKFLSFMIIIFLGLDDNFLRQGLILLPSYLLDSIVICYLILYALTKGDVGSVHLPDKILSKSVLIGAILLTLMKIFASLAFGLMKSNTDGLEPNTAPPETTFLLFSLAVLGLGALLWSFRLVWLHIPLMLGYSTFDYLKRIRGMTSSFIFIATWIMGAVPFIVIVIIFADILSALTSNLGESGQTVFRFVLIAIQAIADTLVGIVTNVAIAFGIVHMMQRSSK